MKLIVGLGNPDKAYAGNRHNIGFMCVDAFARSFSIPVKRRRCQARVGTGEVAGEAVVLAKPQTYMNMSGESVAALRSAYRVSIENIIVVHDDMDLPLGRLRLRQKGSSGGHRGVQSIISGLESPSFSRLRIGIGHPERVNDDIVVRHVLGDFSPQEKEILVPLLQRAVKAIERFVIYGIEIAMNEFNRFPTGAVGKDMNREEGTA